MVAKVKICGLTRREDAELAIELGADALGFVFEPSSPRYLAPEERGFIAELEPYVQCVAVYGLADPPDLSGCNTIQFIHLLLPSDLKVCPAALKVVRPRSLDPAAAIEGLADWYLENPGLIIRGVVLDSFDEHAFGGTGKKLDWGFAADFVAMCDKRVILAGGLTPDNVAAGIETVKPYAVDVSSGVEASPGLKDPIKLRDFIQAAKGTRS